MAIDDKRRDIEYKGILEMVAGRVSSIFRRPNGQGIDECQMFGKGENGPGGG